MGETTARPELDDAGEGRPHRGSAPADLLAQVTRSALRKTYIRANLIKLPRSRDLGLGDLASELLRQIREDHTRAYSGNLAFRGLFAVFAVLVLAFSLLGAFGSGNLIIDLVDELSGPLPEPVVNALRDYFLRSTRGAAVTGLTLRAVTAVVASLYGLAATARAVIDGMNVMYDVPERRSFLRRTFLSTTMALVVLVLFVGATVLFLLGPQLVATLAGSFGLEDFTRSLLTALRWPLLVILLLLVYALVYWSAPAVHVRFHTVSYGALAALVLWLGFTFLFSLYLDTFSSNNATFGALAGVVLLLLYMFFSSFILFIGAEINDILNRHRDTGRLRKRDGSRRPPEAD
jgi:membrane protein